VNHPMVSMNQKIFEMALPVETISVYLLCCGLADAGKPISTRNLLGIWNSTSDALLLSLDDLENRGILFLVFTDQEKNTVYELCDSREWKF